MTVETSDVAREIMAVLTSDLRMSLARSVRDIRERALVSLVSLDRRGQDIVVQHVSARRGLHLVQVRGPDVRGKVSVTLVPKPR